MKEKKKYIIHLIIIAVLIFVDEFVKGMIVFLDKSQIDICKMCDSFIHIHPTYNTHGSFLGWFIGQDYSEKGFILKLVIVNVFAFLLVFFIMGKLNKMDKACKWCKLACDFILAGFLGRLIERLFLYKYTLDYIYVGGIICDLIDIYLMVGALGIGLICIYFEIKKVKFF